MISNVFIMGIFLVFVNSCNQYTSGAKETAAKENEEYFTLSAATSESWVAGVPGGGSGTEYYFNLKINTSETLEFDSAWINNKQFPIFLENESTAVSDKPITFNNGDSITLRVSEINNPVNNSQTNNSQNVHQPFNFEGAALILYSVNNERHYFIVKEIVKQVSPNRP